LHNIITFASSNNIYMSPSPASHYCYSYYVHITQIYNTEITHLCIIFLPQVPKHKGKNARDFFSPIVYLLLFYLFLVFFYLLDKVFSNSYLPHDLSHTLYFILLLCYAWPLSLQCKYKLWFHLF